MNIEDTIRDAFHENVAELSPVGPGPDDARRRAFRRKRRAQSGVLALSVAALAGGSLAVVETRSPGHTPPRVNARPTGQAATTPDLAWKTVDGTVSYDRGHFTTSDGVTYALSTAPGSSPSPTGNDPQELYATHDGVTWTHVSLGADPWVADLTASNGVLYALGTGPGAQDAMTYKLSTSSDGGAQWDGSSLPIVFSKPASSIPLQLTTSAHVARSGNTTVVVANGAYNPDFSTVPDLKDAAVRMTATGVEALDYSACKSAAAGAAVAAQAAALAQSGGMATRQSCTPKVEATHPWSDFGIADPAALQQLQVLVRDDGGDWKIVHLPSSPDTFVHDLTATTNGFVLVESVPSDGQSVERLLSSTDGETWVPLPSAGGGVETVAISGDRIIGVDPETSAISVSNDAGATWVTTPNVAGMVPGDGSIQAYGTTADVGPLGYAVVVNTGLEVASGATADPTKTPATLSPTATVTDRHQYLLYSVDGTSWKVTDLATDGAPANGTVSTTSVGADHIDITYTVSVPVAEGAPPQWKLDTLVGTPKAS